MLTINEALDAYGQARRALDEFKADHGLVLAEHDALTDALIEAQRELTLAMDARKIDFAEDGDFNVTLVRQDRGEYDPRLLSTEALALPGVTRIRIDKGTLERAVAAGQLSASSVAAAWRPKLANPYTIVTVKMAVTP